MRIEDDLFHRGATSVRAIQPALSFRVHNNSNTPSL